MDICPRRTLINWGNSSRLVSLRKLPKPFFKDPSSFTLQPMILGSASILKSNPSEFSPVCSSALCLSASRYILLNLIILKRFPFSPTLVCVKNTGPGSVIHITGAIKTVRTSVTAVPIRPPRISESLLINICHAGTLLSPVVTTLLPPIVCMACCLPLMSVYSFIGAWVTIPISIRSVLNAG